MTPLILIPGMMCDARMWGVVPPGLAPHHVIHALPVTGETILDMAGAILHDAPARFALAGLSMGGIVAMEMLRQAPDRVERLALLDTNPLAETPKVQARRAPQIARVLSGDLDGVMRDEMKPNYLADPADIVTLDLCMDMARALGPDVFYRQSLALKNRADQCDTLARFTGPALVLMGEHDRLCPRNRHDLMHRLMPQSTFVTVPDAGHLPPLEQPQATITALREWIDQ
ncbi:MAG: alpha/beta fold hydrolase [Paracoccaceae bacterium]